MTRGFSQLGALVLGACALTLSGTACEARDCDEVEEVTYEGDGDPERKRDDGACVEFVPLDTWHGEVEEFSGPYEAGKNVLVDSGHGDVSVRVTNRDDVHARFEPFVQRAHDICNGEEDTGDGRCQAIDDDLADQELIFEEEDGHYLIQVQRHDSVGTLGAHIIVELPQNFSGRLSVDQGAGDVDIESIGDAAAIVVENDFGDCSIDTGAAAQIDIRCDGETDVAIGEITTGDHVRQIYKEEMDLGDLVVRFPTTDAPFNVSALSMGGPVVLDPVNLSSVGCETNSSDPRSVTISCNDATSDDPTYDVLSNESLADITLVF